jgi:hypothetical protein
MPGVPPAARAPPRPRGRAPRRRAARTALALPDRHGVDERGERLGFSVGDAAGNQRRLPGPLGGAQRQPSERQQAQHILIIVLAADREGEQIGLTRREAGVEHLECRPFGTEKDALGEDAGKRGEAIQDGL